MKKKIIIILIILALLVSATVVYLNNVVLPTKVKALIIQGIEKKTGKKVTLESLKINIFKGLVLKNLTICEEKDVLVSVEEAYCRFFIWPVFRKQIIIPSINLRSVIVFLERKKDQTVNLQDFIQPKNTILPEEPSKPKQEAKASAGFNLTVYRVSITDATIIFQDDTLPQPFTKNIENINLKLSLSLPDHLKFKFSGQIPGETPVIISGSGEFKIPGQELNADIRIENLLPKDFSGYAQNWGINFGKGSLNSLANIKFKKDILNIGLEVGAKNLDIQKDKILAQLSSDIKGNLEYNFKDKLFKYAGNASITSSRLSGIETAGNIEEINGNLVFNNDGVSCDNLTAKVWGIATKAKLNLKDFSNPHVNINTSSSLPLDLAQGLLKEKFAFIFPGQLKGQSILSLDIKAQVKPPTHGISGYLDITGASVKLDKLTSSVDNINGRLAFNLNQVSWKDLSFKYSDATYKTSGTLTNFKSPGVQLELVSADLSLASVFNIKNKLISLSKLSGRYLNSDFSLGGAINITEPSLTQLDISGGLDLNLEDLNKILPKSKDQLEKIHPSGKVHTQFKLEGNANDLKSCSIDAKVSSPKVSAYGLSGEDFTLSYIQQNGIADISSLHLTLYSGEVDAALKLNLGSKNLPFGFNINAQGVKIEQLKMDTVLKNKDITGNFQGQVKVNGFLGDLGSFKGAGAVSISDGRLWELDLFKGLGRLLFAREFSNIIFSEGSCSFVIADKYISTDNLMLKSDVASVSGPVRIGFDNSIDATLHIDILDELVPLSGTFKDVTTAIIGQSGKFAEIKIEGTLKQPKYKFKPAVTNIIKGLADTFLKKLE